MTSVDLFLHAWGERGMGNKDGHRLQERPDATDGF
jgi:hypothetical protein